MEPQKRHLYFPAEWHRQEMVQLTWPHENTDWNYMLDEVESCFVELAKAISARERLLPKSISSFLTVIFSGEKAN